MRAPGQSLRAGVFTPGASVRLVFVGTKVDMYAMSEERKAEGGERATRRRAAERERRRKTKETQPEVMG